MGFTNSPLATYTRISPNKNSPRTEPITKITVHHMAGVASIETFGNIVANPARQMSANYAIGNDGRIGLFCDEGDRSWCSSSPWNDHRAITIEVSNSAVGGEWPIGEAAYNSLVDLCVDICKRNGIPKLEFTGDKNGSLTFHYMLAQTSCPGPWMKAHAQDLCDKVNARLGNSSSTVLGLYTISLSTGDRIYDSPDGAIVGEISASTKYTIVEEKTIAGGYKYGKLKSGAGWVIVERPAAPTSSDVKTGDLVAIKTGAKYYNGGTIPSWVADDRWYVSSLSGDRAVLGANQSGKNNIQSAININDIFVVSSASSGSTATQTVTLDGSAVIYDNPGGRSISTVGAKGVYTIVETQSSGGAVYGKLKSGAGWVIISGNAPSTEIKVGDWVKVLNPIIYGTNQKFVVYVDKYKVLEISGDRCVISSDGRNVTSAVAKKNLQKL